MVPGLFILVDWRIDGDISLNSEPPIISQFVSTSIAFICRWSHVLFDFETGILSNGIFAHSSLESIPYFPQQQNVFSVDSSVENAISQFISLKSAHPSAIVASFSFLVAELAIVKHLKRDIHLTPFLDIHTEFCRVFRLAHPPLEKIASICNLESIPSLSSPSNLLEHFFFSKHVLCCILMEMKKNRPSFELQTYSCLPPPLQSNPVSRYFALESPLSTAYNSIVRVRGLPFKTSPEDVRLFFNEEIDSNPTDENKSSISIPSVNPLPLGIFMVQSPDGRSSGEAFVRFADSETARSAVRRHMRHFKNSTRYLELFPALQSDASAFLRTGNHTMEAKDVIRLRGLPWTITSQSLLDFLHRRGVETTYFDLVFGTVRDGRMSGEAWVAVRNSDGADAETCRDRVADDSIIDGRQVDVFVSSKEDLAAYCAGKRKIPSNNNDGGVSSNANMNSNLQPLTSVNNHESANFASNNNTTKVIELTAGSKSIFTTNPVVDLNNNNNLNTKSTVIQKSSVNPEEPSLLSKNNIHLQSKTSEEQFVLPPLLSSVAVVSPLVSEPLLCAKEVEVHFPSDKAQQHQQEDYNKDVQAATALLQKLLQPKHPHLHDSPPPVHVAPLVVGDSSVSSSISSDSHPPPGLVSPILPSLPLNPSFRTPQTSHTSSANRALVSQPVVSATALPLFAVSTPNNRFTVFGPPSPRNNRLGLLGVEDDDETDKGGGFNCISGDLGDNSLPPSPQGSAYHQNFTLLKRVRTAAGGEGTSSNAPLIYHNSGDMMVNSGGSQQFLANRNHHHVSDGSVESSASSLRNNNINSNKQQSNFINNPSSLCPQQHQVFHTPMSHGHSALYNNNINNKNVNQNHMHTQYPSQQGGIQMDPSMERHNNNNGFSMNNDEDELLSDAMSHCGLPTTTNNHQQTTVSRSQNNNNSNVHALNLQLSPGHHSDHAPPPGIPSPLPSPIGAHHVLGSANMNQPSKSSLHSRVLSSTPNCFASTRPSPPLINNNNNNTSDNTSHFVASSYFQAGQQMIGMPPPVVPYSANLQQHQNLASTGSVDYNSALSHRPTSSLPHTAHAIQASNNLISVTPSGNHDLPSPRNNNSSAAANSRMLPLPPSPLVPPHALQPRLHHRLSIASLGDNMILGGGFPGTPAGPSIMQSPDSNNMHYHGMHDSYLYTPQFCPAPGGILQTPYSLLNHGSQHMPYLDATRPPPGLLDDEMGAATNASIMMNGLNLSTQGIQSSQQLYTLSQQQQVSMNIFGNSHVNSDNGLNLLDNGNYMINNMMNAIHLTPAPSHHNMVNKSGLLPHKNNIVPTNNSNLPFVQQHHENPSKNTPVAGLIPFSNNQTMITTSTSTTQENTPFASTSIDESKLLQPHLQSNTNNTTNDQTADVNGGKQTTTATTATITVSSKKKKSKERNDIVSILNPDRTIRTQVVAYYPMVRTHASGDGKPGFRREVETGPPCVCIRLRGLPFDAEGDDVIDFFDEFDMRAVLPDTAPVGDGHRPTGEAYVEFASIDVAIAALESKDGQNMNTRSIELFYATKEEMLAAAIGEDTADFRNGRKLVQNHSSPRLEHFGSRVPHSGGQEPGAVVYCASTAAAIQAGMQFSGEGAPVDVPVAVTASVVLPVGGVGVMQAESYHHALLNS